MGGAASCLYGGTRLSLDGNPVSTACHEHMQVQAGKGDGTSLDHSIEVWHTPARVFGVLADVR